MKGCFGMNSIVKSVAERQYKLSCTGWVSCVSKHVGYLVVYKEALLRLVN